jgi:hypothetical protein
MSNALRLTQVHGINFRSQLFKIGNKCVLWVAESADEVYTISFDRAISADIYQPETGVPAKAILLYLDEEEVHSIEMGAFSPEDAMRFLTWLQTAINASA